MKSDLSDSSATGPWLFRGAALTPQLQLIPPSRARVPLTMCDPWMTSSFLPSPPPSFLVSFPFSQRDSMTVDLSECELHFCPSVWHTCGRRTFYDEVEKVKATQLVACINSQILTCKPNNVHGKSKSSMRQIETYSHLLTNTHLQTKFRPWQK